MERNPENIIILVLGSPGAGKTTLINSVNAETRNFEVVNIGTLMAEEVKSQNIPRDRLRYLPTEKIRELRKAHIRWLLSGMWLEEQGNKAGRIPEV